MMNIFIIAEDKYNSSFHCNDKKSEQPDKTPMFRNLRLAFEVQHHVLAIIPDSDF